MARQSAGLLVYRFVEGELEVLLVHPGGPFHQNKDAGVWSIPKGEFTDAEDPLKVAQRELQEETSHVVTGSFTSIGSIRQRGGKIVYAWAIPGDVDADNIRSNTFSMEWPRGSGKTQEFPEVDRAGWFTIDVANEKLKDAQRELLVRLQSLVAARSADNGS